MGLKINVFNLFDFLFNGFIICHGLHGSTWGRFSNSHKLSNSFVDMHYLLCFMLKTIQGM